MSEKHFTESVSPKRNSKENVARFRVLMYKLRNAILGGFIEEMYDDVEDYVSEDIACDFKENFKEISECLGSALKEMETLLPISEKTYKKYVDEFRNGTDDRLKFY